MPIRNNRRANNSLPNKARNGKGNGRRTPSQGLLFVSHGVEFIPNPVLRKLSAYKNSNIQKKVTWKQIREKQAKLANLERILRNETQFAEPLVDREETKRMIETESALLSDMLKRAPKRKKTLAEVSYGMIPFVTKTLDTERRISERQRIVLKTFLKRIRERKVTGKLIKEVDAILRAVNALNERSNQN